MTIKEYIKKRLSVFIVSSKDISINFNASATFFSKFPKVVVRTSSVCCNNSSAYSFVP